MSAAELGEGEAKREVQDAPEERVEVPDSLPVLPLSGMVTFPFMAAI